MARKRIGKNQRAMLTVLELVGPLDWADLDQSSQRGASSLEIQGYVRIVRRAPQNDAERARFNAVPIRVELI